MSEPSTPTSLVSAYESTLLELAAFDPRLVVFSADLPGSSADPSFARTFPDRFVAVPAESAGLLPSAASRSAEGGTIFASGPTSLVVARSYDIVRQAICARGANVKIVATDAGLRSHGTGATPPMLEDIGLMRGLPGMTVVVPADAPSTAAAVRSVSGFTGPAYVRLSADPLPTVTDGSFVLGKAGTLRDGADLTIVAIGALVGRALEVAEELARVGVSVRVLDFASVKPFDEKALLRAARETGAILTLEEHSVLTGVGSLVASATSEEAPVPVRRVGVPDLFGTPVDGGTPLDRYGMSKERCLEEAWALLRARGKVQ